MSIASTSAIYVHLSADASVTTLLGSYGGGPAIFTAQVPQDAPDTYVYIPPPYAAQDASSKTTDQNSRTEWREVMCVVKRSLSVVTVEALANAVRLSLHRAALTPVGPVSFEAVECAGGVGADRDQFFARGLDVRVTCRE